MSVKAAEVSLRFQTLGRARSSGRKVRRGFRICHERSKLISCRYYRCYYCAWPVRPIVITEHSLPLTAL